MATSTVDDLRRYFETCYREGGEFQGEEYEDSEDFNHSWKHLRTGIVVWKDAIDLSARPGAKAFFHYTGELPFRNITALEKEAAEVWASLKTEGESANAWWGRGVYSVPKSPDKWANQMELLDNNFRNMMRRDVELHGEEYVRRVYPPRASFCIPLLIDPENAYDISVRPTPEMEAAGKPPGMNLGDKLLNGRTLLCGSPGGWGEGSYQCSSSPLTCSPRTRSGCSEAWPQDCRESALGECSEEARLLPGKQDPANRSSGGQCSSSPLRCPPPCTRSGCSESWSQDCCQGAFGGGSAEARLLPGKQDFAERRSGGPWAHPRRGASWNIDLGQQFGNLLYVWKWGIPTN